MKRLSLFDQLQIRFPIRARTNVRRSAEAGAAAASMSKSGFGGSLLTNMAMCPQMQADNIHSFDGTDFVAREVHIERYISRGWGRIPIQPLHSKMSPSCYDLAAVPFFPTTSCHTRASWHSIGTRVNFYAQL